MVRRPVAQVESDPGRERERAPSPEPQRRTPRVGISGSYGGINLGDEAILESIITELRRSLTVDITVFTRDPADTQRRHPDVHAVPIRDLTREEARREVEDLDAFVLGGGGILFDGEAEAYLREVALAQESGVPVMVYAVSAGPLADARAREAVRSRLDRVDVVTVRDRRGLQILEETGVHRSIHLTADPALLLTPDPMSDRVFKEEGLDRSHRLVGFSVREPGPAAPDIDVDHYHALLANAADFMIERLDADIVFVPMERRHMDLQHSHAVISRMQGAQRATVLKGEYTPRQIMWLIEQFEFAVGMRLHFLIFAALQGIPFTPLPYAPKVLGLIQDLELEAPPMNVTTGRLIATIDRSWDYRDELQERIRQRMPALQARARESNRLLVDLLTRARPKAGRTG